MKNSILLFILLITTSLLGQNKSDLEKELDQVKTMRLKDSAKIELLLQELKSIVTAKENEQKEAVLKQLRIEDSLNFLRRQQEIESYRAKTEGVPVVFFADTLYHIYTALGSFEAKDRAQFDLNKINKLYNQYTFKKDSIKLNQFQSSYSLSYQNEIITSVTELDALWVGKPLKSLALEYKEIIGQSIEKYRKENSLQNKVLRYGQLLLFILSVFVLFAIINKFINFLKNKIAKNESVLSSGIKFKNYQLVKRDKLTHVIERIFDVFKYILYFITIFSIVPFALNLFPQTAIWVDDFNLWIQEPLLSVKNSIIDYLPNIIKIGLIIFIGRIFIRILKFFSIEIARENLIIRGFYPEWAAPTFSLIRFVLNIFILIIIFPLLPGADSVAFKGISVFLGVLLSIGSSSAISNAVSGLVITYMRPFKVGDWIKTKNITGVVIEKNVLVTRLRTFNNEDVTVPNSSILNDHTINYSSIGKKKGLALSVRVKTRYDYNVNIIEQRLIEAALRTEHITKNIPPYVLQIDFNDQNVTYEINAYTYEPNQMFFTRSDLARNIRNVFEEAGIKFAVTSYIEIKSVDELGNTKTKNPTK